MCKTVKQKLPVRIRGVLFDFDGTLTRPHAIDFAAIKRAISCPPTEPILEFIRQLPASDRPAAQAVLERFEEESAAAACPNDGAEELVARLRARRMPMGVLTRNTRASVIVSLANFKTTTPADFAVILTRDDVANHKPHPEGVHLAAARLGVDVAALAVVGDYRYDIEAGRQAGAMTFFLANGAPPPPEIIADGFLNILTDFKPYLNSSG